MIDQTTGAAVLEPRKAVEWSYLVEEIHARHNDVLEDGLRQRGREGWELVFVHMPLANSYVCIFRRPEG